MKNYWEMTEEELRHIVDSFWEEIQSLRKSIQKLSVHDPKRQETHRRIKTAEAWRSKAINVSTWRRVVGDDDTPRVYLVGDRDYDVFEMKFTSLDAKEAFDYYLTQRNVNSIEWHKLGEQ